MHFLKTWPGIPSGLVAFLGFTLRKADLTFVAVTTGTGTLKSAGTDVIVLWAFCSKRA